MNYRLSSIIATVCMAMLSACHTNTYGTMVCGEVYMADGTQKTVANDDRLKMPSRRKDLVVVHNIYKVKSKKAKYRYADIDSIRVWHPASADETWTIVPVPGYGWCLRYVANPHISVLTYSRKGYGLFASGRAANFYTRGIFTKSEVHFLIEKPGMPPSDIGSVSGYGGERWRERLCEYVADDPELCKTIMQSKRRKHEILRVLSSYNPNQQTTN